MELVWGWPERRGAAAGLTLSWCREAEAPLELQCIALSSHFWPLSAVAGALLLGVVRGWGLMVIWEWSGGGPERREALAGQTLS